MIQNQVISKIDLVSEQLRRFKTEDYINSLRHPPRFCEDMDKLGLIWSDIFRVIFDYDLIRHHDSSGDCFCVEGHTLCGKNIAVVLVVYDCDIKVLKLWETL